MCETIRDGAIIKIWQIHVSAHAIVVHTRIDCHQDGKVVRLKGAWQSDRLLVFDQKAMYHVLVKVSMILSCVIPLTLITHLKDYNIYEETDSFIEYDFTAFWCPLSFRSKLQLKGGTKLCLVTEYSPQLVGTHPLQRTIIF